MVLGQSAATAAALALSADVPIQEVAYTALRQRLLADQQVLAHHAGSAGGPTGRDPTTFAGLVVDDAGPNVERLGFEATSTSVGGFIGDGYRHDGNVAKGEQWIAFHLPLPTSGRYAVRIGYQPHPNRATNVPVLVRHAEGETRLKVNQRQPPSIEDVFTELGVFRFDKAAGATLRIDNEKTDGYVVIDAIQLVPKE